MSGINDVVIKISTVNGTGSASANGLLMKAIFRMGIPVVSKNYFPSNIQGLPTWYEIRISGDGLDSLHAAVSSGGIGRHRHDPGVQAAEKRRNEIEPGRIQQERPLTGQLPLLQRGCDRPGTAIDFRIGQPDFFLFAVFQVKECPLIGQMQRLVTEQFNQIGWPKERTG